MAELQLQCSTEVLARVFLFQQGSNLVDSMHCSSKGCGQCTVSSSSKTPSRSYKHFMFERWPASSQLPAHSKFESTGSEQEEEDDAPLPSQAG